MSVLKKKLLKNFMTKMSFIAIQSLFDDTVYTNTYSLTFNGLHFPEILKIGYLLVRIEQYLPVPLHCTKYEKFDDQTTKCKNPQYTCWHCHKHHEPDHCNSEDLTICINCQVSHHFPPYVSDTLTNLPSLKHANILNLKLKLHML